MTIAQVAQSISNAMNMALQNSMVAPLQDGGVLLGREFADDRRAANSIVIVPVATEFGTPQIQSLTDSVAVTSGRPGRERSRNLASRKIHFEVHVWGAAQPNDQFNDWDIAEALSETFVAVVYLMVGAGNLTWGRGTWIDQMPGETRREGLGHYLIFPMALEGSVVDTAVNFLPPGTVMKPTLNLNVEIG